MAESVKADERMDAACALLVEEGNFSTRQAGTVLGVSRTTVHNRVKRFRSAGSPKRHRSWAEGFVAGRMLQVATPTERAESWEDRLSRLKETPNIWQEAHVMPYNSATTAVSKLRTRRHDFSQGGSWQFRVEKRGEQGAVMAKWCGTPCTSCGGVALDDPENPNTCPLCGADKGAP